MKATLLLGFAALLVACSQNNTQTETQQAPPEMKQERTFLNVAPTLLASEKDPVCGMKIKNKVVDTARYEHKLYGFCGVGCKEAFLSEPLTYLKSAEPTEKN